jgi:hypothetical protein
MDCESRTAKYRRAAHLDNQAGPGDTLRRMNHTNDDAEQVHAPDMKRSGPLRIGILAARDLGFAFWERRLFEKLASDPRFEISAIIVDGREPPPRKGIYSRLTNPHLPNAVIRRLTRMIDNAAMTYEPDVPAPVFEARLARTPHITVSPHRNGHVDRFAAADVERIRDLDLDILLRHGFGILKGDILELASREVVYEAVWQHWA